MISAYTKTTVADNTNRVLASHHNTQEDQLEALTAHALAAQELIVQNVAFGTVAAGVTAEKAVFVAPGALTLAYFRLVNGADVAASGVNNTKLELINKDIDGSGTTVLATFDGATDSFTAFEAFAKTVTTALAKETVLSLSKTETGSGAGVTDLMVQVAYKPNC
jgi:hypothetical protein